MTEERLVVIVSPGLATGFALAGVEVFEEARGRDAADRIERLVDESQVGVVVIDDDLYRDLPDEFLPSLRRKVQTVVIPIPGPEWAAESKAHEYIVDILRRAIGYRVRLQ